MLRPVALSRATALSIGRNQGGVGQPGLSEYCRQHAAMRCRCLSDAPQGVQLLIQRFEAAEGPDIVPANATKASSCSRTAPMMLPTPAGPLLAAAMLCLPGPAEASTLQSLVGGLEDLIQSSGALGPFIFVAAYVVATVLLVPGSLLTVVAGFLFGPVLGTLLVSLASTSGAAAAFLVGRYLARPAVESRIQSNTRFAAVDAAIGRQGPRIVLLLRLSPLFPFTLLNYALSLTKVEFGPYVLASWIGMLPGTVAYVALGGAGKAAAETATGGGPGAVQLVLYAVGAGATLWAASLISKAASQALEEAAAVEAESKLGSADATQPPKVGDDV